MKINSLVMMNVWYSRYILWQPLQEYVFKIMFPRCLCVFIIKYSQIYDVVGCISLVSWFMSGQSNNFRLKYSVQRQNLQDWKVMKIEVLIQESEGIPGGYCWKLLLHNLRLDVKWRQVRGFFLAIHFVLTHVSFQLRLLKYFSTESPPY